MGLHSGSYAPSTWPPIIVDPFETEEERLIRIEDEKEAKKVSDSIDQSIGVEREKRRRPPDAKILLLGQAESGKSTVLKNIQLHFAPKAFLAECELWRPVIHLNLLRSVNFIIDFLKHQARPTSRPTSPASSPPRSTLPEDIRRLLIQLAPLKHVEESLTKGISGFIAETSGTDSLLPRYHPSKASEVSVRSGMGWKGLLRVRRHSSDTPRVDKQEDMDNRRIIAACTDDIIALWKHKEVQERLKGASISLHDQPGFFLDDVDRIARVEYTPSPPDILRARVRTIGPEEHRIPLENEFGKEWVVYDVGGSRSQRAAWAQFFDDVTAIIFLAPISAFNQVLAEDETVNRLADSLKLWRTICSNKLLSSVNLILFLNKMDILDMQLQSGIQFGKYVTSYKNKPNDAKSVAKYLGEVFVSLHNQYALKRRNIHVHLTCATDTRATSVVINEVRDVILVKALAETAIL